MNHLSKSRFCSGLQCLKMLYWTVHPPEGWEDEEDPVLRHRMEEGHEVGRLACRRHSGGVLVSEDHTQPQEALARTAALVADPKVPAIFEGAFSHDRVLVRVDILERLPHHAWRLIEVKSTSGVKEQHIPDLAIQRHVLEGCGLHVVDAYLLHLNGDYVYPGGELDLAKLFTLAKVNRRAEGFASRRISELIARMLAVLSAPQAPDVAPGEQCTAPYECGFYDLCHAPVPEDALVRLPRINEKKLSSLAKPGVKRIRDIPANFELTESQRNAWRSCCSGRAYVGPGARGELGHLPWPRYYMDFETCNPAIPRFPGMRPRGIIPFQWSVHVQSGKDKEPRHFSFLADEGHDPREEFIAQLIPALGQQGPILVYNAAFEEGRLDEIAVRLPARAPEIAAIKKRLWDLLPFVRRHVYHPAFAGSYSLKKVLPALVPTLSYQEMEIGEGGAASLAYEELARGLLDPKERERIKKALLAYCLQDTLGMVRLVAVITRASSGTLGKPRPQPCRTQKKPAKERANNVSLKNKA